MKPRSLALTLALLLAAAAAGAQPSGIRGDSPAIAAAERILKNAGGRETWRKRQMEVEERAYLRSGEVARIRISRDFSSRSRRIESVTSSRRILSWMSPDGGWRMRNGEVTRYARHELAAELQGFMQEPYAVYHRLAIGDPAIRVELRDDGARLLVYDSDERLLNWYQLDALGNTIGWGNLYDDSVTQHHYGPFEDLGDASLPRWGASADGNWRFEYISVRMGDHALTEPSIAEERPKP
jgi:hypothetical protein